MCVCVSDIYRYICLCACIHINIYICMYVYIIHTYNLYIKFEVFQHFKVVTLLSPGLHCLYEK